MYSQHTVRLCHEAVLRFELFHCIASAGGIRCSKDEKGQLGLTRSREAAWSHPDAVSTKWKTWSPFQSAQVREICAHMTEAESTEATRRGGLYGLWVFATFAGPLSFSVVFHHPVLIAAASVLVVIHVACIPAWLKMQRGFLCSNGWASEQGVTPERLRLFSFQV